MTSMSGDGRTKKTFPTWFMPAIVCGAVPSVLFLLVSFALFIGWLFRDEPTEPLAAQESSPRSERAVEPTEENPLTRPETQPEPLPDKVASSEETKRAPVAKAVGPRERVIVKLKPGYATLSTVARDYAYDHELGQLGILGPWGNSVGFISIGEQTGGTLRNVKVVTMRGYPQSLIYQAKPSGGGVFGVAQTKAAGVILVDSESLKVVKSLRVDDHPRFLSLAEDPDPNYLYFSTGDVLPRSVVVAYNVAYNGPIGWEGQMQRLDLKTMELDTRYQGEEFQTSNIFAAGGGI